MRRLCGLLAATAFVLFAAYGCGHQTKPQPEPVYSAYCYDGTSLSGYASALAPFCDSGHGGVQVDSIVPLKK